LSLLLTGARASSVLYNFLEQNTSVAGKKWLIPINVCKVVPLTFYSANAHFKYCDITALDLFIDLSNQDFNEVHGILVIAPYGATINARITKQLTKIKVSHPEILVIFDLCLSMPVTSKPNSDIPDLVLYSSGYSKPVDIGHGGFGYSRFKVENNKKGVQVEAIQKENFEEQILKLGNGDIIGYKADWLDLELNNLNSKSYFSEIKDEFDGSKEHRRCLISIYQAMLPKRILLKDEYQSWRFNVLVPNKEELLISISNAGLFASTHYAMAQPMHNMPVAFELSKFVLNLFFDSYFTEEKAISICKVINTHIELYLEEESFILLLNKFSSVRK